MDKKLEVYWVETDKLLDEKMAEYEGVESMKAFYYFLKGAKLDNAFRAIDGRLDTGHLEAVRQDVSWKERHYRAEAGLLSPEEAAARKAFMDFMNSPCDLPPEVDIKIDYKALEKKKRQAKFKRIRDRFFNRRKDV